MRIRLAALLLVAAVAAGLSDDLRVVAVAAVAALASAMVLDPRVVRSALRIGLWLAVAVAAAAAGTAVTLVQGSHRGLVAAVAVLLRLVILWLAAGVMARSIDADRLVAVARRLGLERIGLVLGLALNALPRLVETVADVWMVHRLRSAGRWSALRHAPRVVEVLLANAARIGDDAAAAASLRGHTSLIQARRAALDAPARVVIVTGSPGSGKTAAVDGAVAVWRRQGRGVVGIVQPGILQDGRKVGFEVRDLATGAELELARRVGRRRGEHGTPFAFSRQGLDLAAAALGRAGAGDILVVDEVGPIELRGGGHMPALRRAMATPGLAAVVLVVRRHLIPSLLAALSRPDALVVDLDEGGASGVDGLVSAVDRVSSTF